MIHDQIHKILIIINYKLYPHHNWTVGTNKLDSYQDKINYLINT